MLSSYYGLFVLILHTEFSVFFLENIVHFPKLSLAAVFIIVLMFSYCVSISSCVAIFPICCVTPCVNSHLMPSSYSNLILKHCFFRTFVGGFCHFGGKLNFACIKY
jgi:hypothetical protein